MASTSLTAVGSIEGQPVTWSYEPPLGDEDGKLSWTEDAEPTAESGWTHIETKTIVAIVPNHSPEDPKDSSTILYTVANDHDGDSAASPYVLKSVAGTNLPSQVMQDYQLTSLYLGGENHDQGNFHVIISTQSGTKQAFDAWEKLVKPALDLLPRKDEQQATVHQTESENSVTDILRDEILPKANAGKATAVLLLSGDGGLVDAANALLSKSYTPGYRKPTLALLPLGTGNAMAHSANITADKTLGLATAFRGLPREIPLFAATFSPGARLLANEALEEHELTGRDETGLPRACGAVVCSWGLHASLVADSDTTEFRKYGAARFQMAAKEALFPSDGSLPHPYRGKVSVLRSQGNDEGDWQVLERETHSYVLATLVSRLEAGFTISPASQPLDGKLRLVHFGAVSGQEAMEVMTKAYQGGKHVEDARVGYEEIRGLRIDFDEDDAQWRRVCVDGKITRVEKGGWVEVKVGVQSVADLITM